MTGTAGRAAALYLALAGAPALADRASADAVIAPLAATSLLLDVAAAGPRLVAVGERGHVLLSDDGGASWAQAPVPTRATLTGVHFHDAERGWAVGHDAVILRTGDGGSSWAQVHAAPEEERPLLDVWFRDEAHGFAIGAYGFFLVTEDGGESWSDGQVSEDDFHLNQISSAGDGRLYIAAEAGLLYRSDDAGESWSELPSPYEGSFFGTLALDGDSVLAFGLRGHLFRSDDGGESWTALETRTESLLGAAVRTGEGTFVVAGLAGTVLVSTDGGRTFTSRALGDRRGITALTLAADGSVVAVGEGGARIMPGP